ncbi:hypothetical protein GCM10007907_16850 [Chitinimonas prasina]|uniref:Methyltransferase n=1 Tax=Chitinimonas prasina TaxID=1434937 RepID=A0ABQ5YHR2_9NEIS|nr:major capsid protein [Chitinimonas prasina]GLR12895.1 hypothetical protein GCM10007907_16850 [Chitinimonas prasina]
MKYFNQARRYAPAIAAAAVATVSFAADGDLDVSSLVTKVAAVSGSVILIGLAILGVVATIAGIGWIRRVVK